MKKITFLLLLMLCSYNSFAQKVPVSINGSYRTDFAPYSYIRDWGIGVQAMVPIYKGLHIAPGISYFFKSSQNYILTTAKHQSINYGVDIHYAFNLPNNKILVSPFIGVEAATFLFDDSKKQVNSAYEEIFGKSIDMEGMNENKTEAFGNVGISGKWFMTDCFFVNSQVKFSVWFKELDSNFFTFSAGIGYAF